MAYTDARGRAELVAETFIKRGSGRVRPVPRPERPATPEADSPTRHAVPKAPRPPEGTDAEWLDWLY